MNPRPLDPQSAGGESEGTADTPLASGRDGACTRACTSAAENVSNQADRLEVIADLLADLPTDQRAEVIAELDSTERLAIARMLVRKRVAKGKKPVRNGGKGVRSDD